MPDKGERLQAFCSVTFDDAFVIRDIKIIEGTRGCFVAMPSRKLTDRCPGCGSKNHLRARFCSHCGGRLDENRAGHDAAGRSRLHADIAHPINSQCREEIQGRVLEAYRQELAQSQQPGYQAPSLVEHDYDYEEEHAGPVTLEDVIRRLEDEEPDGTPSHRPDAHTRLADAAPDDRPSHQPDVHPVPDTPERVAPPPDRPRQEQAPPAVRPPPPPKADDAPKGFGAGIL